MEPTDREVDAGDDHYPAVRRWPAQVLEACRNAVQQNGAASFDFIASNHVEAVMENGHENGSINNEQTRQQLNGLNLMRTAFQQNHVKQESQNTDASPSSGESNGGDSPQDPPSPAYNTSHANLPYATTAEGAGDALAQIQKMQLQDLKVGDYDVRHLASMYEKNFPSLPFQPPILSQQPGFLIPGSNRPVVISPNSAHSSEGSNSSTQNPLTFEEQFKQLYDLDPNDQERKAFLDDLFSFMQRIGKPINRLPIMAKSVLDLYQLYKLVIARGGLVEVINKKLWQEIIKGLNLPSTITSAAFTLRTQYMRYLFPYETEKFGFSSEAELNAAIDGNKREGRRSSYGHPYMPRSSPNRQNDGSPQMMSARQALGLPNGNPGLNPGQPFQFTQQFPQLNGLNGSMVSPVMPSEFHNRLLDFINKGAGLPGLSGAPGLPIGPGAVAFNNQLWNAVNNNHSTINHAINNVKPPQEEALNLSSSPPLGSNDSQPGPSQETQHQPGKRQRDDSMETEPEVSPRRMRMDQEAPTQHVATSIKIQSRPGDGRNPEGLVVTIEVNGISYQGLLFSQAPKDE